jgi:microsomal dipeptidase-like Zn-dependent dipeptidase
VSTYPALFKALLEDKEGQWTEEELRKIVGENMLRVMERVEEASAATKTYLS